jgi:ribosomal protein S27AE
MEIFLYLLVGLIGFVLILSICINIVDNCACIGKKECPRCGKRSMVSGVAGSNCWSCGYIAWNNRRIKG